MNIKLQRCNLLWAILDKVVTLLNKCCSQSATTFNYTVGLVQNKPTIQTHISYHMPLEISINNLQQIPVTLHPQDAAGRPAPVQDGSVVWTVVSGDATVVEQPDGTGLLVSQNDAVGDTTFRVDADADLGQGVEDIFDTVLLHVISPHATSVGLQAGTIEPKPAAEPKAKAKAKEE